MLPLPATKLDLLISLHTIQRVQKVQLDSPVCNHRPAYGLLKVVSCCGTRARSQARMSWSLASQSSLEAGRMLQAGRMLLHLVLEQLQSNQEEFLLQAKVQEGDAQLSRLQAALQSQQARSNQLQNTLQATEAQLQEAHALTNAEHLQVTLLQEAASAREAAVQLLTQQVEDAEQKVRQQGLELQVMLIQQHGCSTLMSFWPGFTA